MSAFSTNPCREGQPGRRSRRHSAKPKRNTDLVGFSKTSTLEALPMSPASDQGMCCFWSAIERFARPSRLRLISLLCPDKRPVGYSLSRRGAERGYRPENLPKFDRIPAQKSGLIPLLFRFAFRDRSVALVTEGLGRQKFHRNVAILVNEHSASASEMVAAFAAENGLATIVGTKTAGRLMGASAFKVGFGYC